MFIVITTLVKFAILHGFLMALASLLTWMERRQSAFSQDRLGPYKAALTIGGRQIQLAGLLHIAADGLKMFFKEPFIPATADKPVFKVAPAISFVTAHLVIALVPFGPDIPTMDFPGMAWMVQQGWVAAETVAKYPVIPMQVARLDSGLLFIFAIGSLGVYSAALAGWASNNRFALMGGLRAAAQGISYEVALGLTAVGALIAYGSTELHQMVQAQEGTIAFGLPAWGIFLQPLGAVLFLTAAIAETKRGPFDLPEGESEIIGYFVEYSSMGFGLFMLSEFIEIVVLASVFTTLFLGGYELPWLVGANSWDLGVWYGTPDFLGASPAFWNGIAGFAIFGLKVFLLAALQLQIRWTLPRFRYDQLMHLGWKTLLPLALANIFITALVVWLDPTLHLLGSVGLGMIALFALVVIAGPRRGRVVHAPAAHGHDAHAAPAHGH